MKDAYAGLKEVLQGKLGSLANLEDDPNDDDYRRAAEKELQRKELLRDPSIRQGLDQLSKALEGEDADRLALAGVDIQRVRAAGQLLIKDVVSGAGGVSIKDVDARGGDARIEGVRAGGTEKN